MGATWRGHGGIHTNPGRPSLATEGNFHLQEDISVKKQKLLLDLAALEEQEPRRAGSQRVKACTARGGGSRRGARWGPGPSAQAARAQVWFLCSLLFPPPRNCLIRAAAGQLASSLHLLNRSPPTVIFANPGEIFNWLAVQPLMKQVLLPLAK